jgi:hypothetical protein
MHRVNRIPFALLAGCSLLASGCSLPKGDFPSLAKRPYENSDPIAEAAAEPTQLSTSLADNLQSQLLALESRHSAADSAFRAALTGARESASAAAGAATGSESWVNAHLQVTRLEKMRADSTAALADIDKLIAAERLRGSDAGVIGLMEAYQQRVQRAVEAQTAAIMELTNRIG